MKNKNKIKNSFDLLLKVFERMLMSDKAVAISLFFCIALTVVILRFSNQFIMNIKEALYFMFGVSVMFLTLNFILNSTNNYLDIGMYFQNLLNRLLNAPKCKICNKTMKIFINKKSKSYVWKCKEHSKEGKQVRIKCPICHTQESLSSKYDQLTKCNHCKSHFLPSDVNKKIERRFCHLIKEKFPKPQITHIQNNLQTSFKNIIFLIVFSLIISMINFITFSNKGKELLASLFNGNIPWLL